jgi:tRNA(Ile)-lysidine synthase
VAGSVFLSPLNAAEAFLGRLARPATILVAVSGGSDSVGLLFALHQALRSAEEGGIRLVAATVDHGLRPESAKETEVVALLCRELSIPHLIRRWAGEKPKSGISAAAREARYRLLADAAEEVSATAIVTGHTFDDQSETVAMRAARSEGEGNLGLAGMAEAVLLDRRHWLLRPFLLTRRDAIRDLLADKGRGWIDDPSNTDRHYERVRVRAALPDESAVTPEAILEAGKRRLRLSERAAALAARDLRVEHGVLACLSADALTEEADIVRHLLGVLAGVLGGRPHMPATRTMDRVMAMLEGRQPGRITAGRVIFDLRHETLFMHREVRGLPVLQVEPGETRVWDGRYRISNHAKDAVSIGPEPPDRDVALKMFADVPPAIAMRAMGVMPRMDVMLPLATDDKAGVTVAPVLAPHDRFLPQFELILACKLGLLFGCEAFPGSPIKVFERKS